MPDEKKNWWELQGWRDQQIAKAAQLTNGNKTGTESFIAGAKSTIQPSYCHPDCKHERCSYDILTCPKCIEYTKQKNVEHAKQTTMPSSS